MWLRAEDGMMYNMDYVRSMRNSSEMAQGQWSGQGFKGQEAAPDAEPKHGIEILEDGAKTARPVVTGRTREEAVAILKRITRAISDKVELIDVTA